jgi:hypothetical protein
VVGLQSFRVIARRCVAQDDEFERGAFQMIAVVLSTAPFPCAHLIGASA